LVLLSQFIVKNYPQITIEEIDLAIDLSLTDKLDVDVRTFNNFSPMYVSRILNGYIEHRKRLYHEIYSRKVKEEEIKQMQKKATPQEERDLTIEIIRDFYNKYKTDGYIDDVFNILYNYLKKSKKLNPSKEVIDEAIKYGKIKAEEHINSYFADVFIKERPDKKELENRYARNYCVCKFFDTLNLEEFLSKIEISEFE
jgi:polyhydroxyalkanoate synthesis regulator phasin